MQKAQSLAWYSKNEIEAVIVYSLAEKGTGIFQQGCLNEILNPVIFSGI